MSTQKLSVLRAQSFDHAENEPPKVGRGERVDCKSAIFSIKRDFKKSSQTDFDNFFTIRFSTIFCVEWILKREILIENVFSLYVARMCGCYNVFFS